MEQLINQTASPTDTRAAASPWRLLTTMRCSGFAAVDDPEHTTSAVVCADPGLMCGDPSACLPRLLEATAPVAGWTCTAGVPQVFVRGGGWVMVRHFDGSIRWLVDDATEQLQDVDVVVLGCGELPRGIPRRELERWSASPTYGLEEVLSCFDESAVIALQFQNVDADLFAFLTETAVMDERATPPLIQRVKAPNERPWEEDGILDTIPPLMLITNHPFSLSTTEARGAVDAEMPPIRRPALLPPVRNEAEPVLVPSHHRPTQDEPSLPEEPGEHYEPERMTTPPAPPPALPGLHAENPAEATRTARPVRAASEPTVGASSSSGMPVVIVGVIVVGLLAAGAMWWAVA